MGGSRPFKIGIITNLENWENRLGSGIINSAIYGVDRYCQDNPVNRESFEIDFGDDFGQASVAYDCARRFHDDGALAIIGPSDSQAARQVLENTEFGALPFIITFATATQLAEYGTNMFRSTSNDRKRAGNLVSEIKTHCRTVFGERKIYHYSLLSAEGSYAHGLGLDVEAALSVSGLTYEKVEFARRTKPDLNLPPPSPVIISAPSAQAADLVRELRNSGHRGPIYGFGSNSNLLTPDCKGMVVISDLHRASSNPAVQRELDGFSKAFPKETEPSLATMNGSYALIDAIVNAGIDPEGDSEGNRKKLHDVLMRTKLQAMFGEKMTFDDENGELMSGTEAETLERLQVAERENGLEFVSPVVAEDNRVETLIEKVVRQFAQNRWLRWSIRVILAAGAFLGWALGVTNDWFGLFGSSD